MWFKWELLFTLTPGEVLEFEMSNTIMQVPLSPEEFDEWFQEHKNSKKMSDNYEGSSNAVCQSEDFVILAGPGESSK